MSPRDLETRSYHLSGLGVFTAREIADVTRAGRRAIRDRLATLCAAERRRGLTGHWAYDLARHHNMLALYEQESNAVLAMARAEVEAMEVVAA